MIRPPLPRVRDGDILGLGLMNGIINRVEYAADLLRQGRPLAGDGITVEENYNGTTISSGDGISGEFWVGWSASTGAARQYHEIGNIVTIHGQGTFGFNDFLFYGNAVGDGNFIRLTDNAFGQSGAVWLKRKFFLPLSISANVSLSGGGDDGYFADGLCCNISKFGPALGGGGGGLGMSGLPVLTAEIDTFQNFFDPSVPHIAITKNGDVSNHIVSKSFSSAQAGGNISGNFNVQFDGKTISASLLFGPGLSISTPIQYP